MTQEDPRELARRLADEAKRRLQVSVPPPPPDPIVEDEEWAGPPDEVEPDITMAAPPPVTERATGQARAMSALEALAAAREAERRQSETRRSAPQPENAERPERSEQAASSHRPERTERPQAAPRSAGGPPVTRAAAVVVEVFPHAAIEAPTPVANPDVFRALWRAHRARAVHTGDLALTVTASVLIDAVDRIAPGCLIACRVTIGEHRFAAWVDVERNALLGLAGPPDVYLAT